jgi:transglutaminase-like putative cysteine protease
VRLPKLLLLCVIALPLWAREFDIRPAPAWVEHVDADMSLKIAKEHVRWGIYDILTDHQVRVGTSSESQYFRTVRRVLSPSGVQNASELTLDFDPDFERLAIHSVTVLRGGSRIDAIDPDEIRVIDKEDDADDKIYDGQRSALVILRDVRPGDIIDYSWSLDGANPLLGGKYTDEYDLSRGVPSHRIRHRLLWPAGRPLQWRGADPVIATVGGEQSYVWERGDVDALAVEDSIPTWYEPWEMVQVTEFASWNEVAAWATAMFRLDAHSTEEVKKLAAKIYGENPTREARITAAIRFVQDEIRYLGIEMGRNSHEPHQPSETLSTRWGDCKDKALLLVSLLRELGLEAYPALVNTTTQHRLDEKLPSPFLFDHVIAQVIDAGRVYWVDGTIADQGGTLRTLETPNDGRALVVRAETHGLTAVETNTKGSTFVEQTYTTTDYAKPTALMVKTTLSGSDADAFRSDLASMSIDDFANTRINGLATDQPKISADGAPRIADDRLRNTIVVTEKYRVAELWKDGHWTWYPRVLDSHLRRPETMIRSMPLAFDYPLDVRQIATFNFPETVEVENSTTVTETPTFRYEYTVDRNGKTVTIRQSLHARRDYIAAKDVPDHLTKLNAIWSEVGYRLAPEGARPAPVQRASAMTPAKWGLGLFIAGAFVGLCWMFATRRRGTFAPLAAVAFRPGEAPVSAVAIRGTHEINAHLAALACACGAAHYNAPDVQRALYAEREMTIVTRQCAACGREQSVYFTAA